MIQTTTGGKHLRALKTNDIEVGMLIGPELVQNARLLIPLVDMDMTAI
jgi:hypothetical protein